jgi:hypothetical protein
VSLRYTQSNRARRQARGEGADDMSALAAAGFHAGDF